MPEEVQSFLPREHLLTFEEIKRIVLLLTTQGLRKIRLTGGEPLMRRDLDQLIKSLGEIDQIEDIALTTNGILLPKHAASLHAAGLQRINISLDTLSEVTFQKISRREGLDQVIAGIDSAIATGFDEVRLNALSIRDLTENEVLPLVQFARERNLTMRFIEYMPLDADRSWSRESVLTGEEVRNRIEAKLGTLQPADRNDPSQPSVDFQFTDGSGTVGFINPVSKPFCNDCNRLRLSADGKLQNCLFSDQGWDLKTPLREGASNEQLLAKSIDCVKSKEAGHLISQPDFQQPQRAMYQIGG